MFIRIFFYPLVFVGRYGGVSTDTAACCFKDVANGVTS